METIEYKLKSNPNRTVMVPKDYADKAESLLNLAIERPEDLHDAFDEHPYLSNPGILARVASLTRSEPGSADSLKLEDEVFLRAATGIIRLRN